MYLTDAAQAGQEVGYTGIDSRFSGRFLGPPPPSVTIYRARPP